MKCSGEKPPTAQFWPVFPFNADFKCHLCITTFNVRLSCCSEGRDNLLALIIKGNQSKGKEKRDEKCGRYSRFKLPGCLWAVRDGADRNVLIFNRADVFLFPFLCVSASQINVTLHYNRSCRDYFSADRKPVRKRACRWQAFAFLCLVQWNARLCAVSEMQQSVSGVNTKTRVFFPGKDGSGLFISRALLQVRAPLPADGRRTLLQLHSFSINISYSRFTGFCFSVKSPVQPVRGRKESKHHVFHLTQPNFFKWKCVVT